jgi:hypothetical protein
MLDASTIIAAWLSLIASAVTIWWTTFRRGAVRMTQPAFIFFGPDGGNGKPKVAMCAHLYTTAQRGAIVEGMFVRLTRGTLAPVTQDFDVWVHGSNEGLARGSGVHVGQEGVTCNHHFLLPRGTEKFEFEPGSYIVEIFGTIVGRAGTHRFWHLKVTLTEPIHKTGDGVFFDWRPSLEQYEAHADRREERVERQSGMLKELMLSRMGGPMA